MTLSDRLEAGADAVWSAGLNPSLTDARRDFETALRAAFPEMFVGEPVVLENPVFLLNRRADGTDAIHCYRTIEVAEREWPGIMGLPQTTINGKSYRVFNGRFP